MHLVFELWTGRHCHDIKILFSDSTVWGCSTRSQWCSERVGRQEFELSVALLLVDLVASQRRNFTEPWLSKVSFTCFQSVLCISYVMFQCAEARSNANWSRRSCHAVALLKLFICLCRVGSVCFQADCITCHQMHFCPQGHLGRRWWQRRIHAHPPISWRRHAMLAPCRRNQWIFCNSKICSLSEYFFLLIECRGIDSFSHILLRLPAVEDD